jgi:heme a synthase
MVYRSVDLLLAVCARRLLGKCMGLAVGIGLQGVLGWYMVKSGLEEPEHSYDVARVSQYRLAAHFGAATLLYGGMLWATLNLFLPSERKLPATSEFLSVDSEIAQRAKAMFQRVRVSSRVVAGMVLLTAMSGAFVAGLDAGLIYNDFPYMGGRDIVPEGAWTFDTVSRQTNERSPPQLGSFLRFNLFEDPAAVQFNHRVLAVSTATAITALFGFQLWFLRKSLPASTKAAFAAMMAMAATQVSLGIATLLYLVPTPLAATHQGGALVLLSTALWCLQELKRVPVPK